MEALSPRTSLGLTEVPSSGATTGVAPLLTTLLDFAAFFLALSCGMVPFPFESSAVLLFLLGEMSGTSSRGHFSLITMPLADRVAALDPLAKQASFCMSIFLDIAAKEKWKLVDERDKVLKKRKKVVPSDLSLGGSLGSDQASNLELELELKLYGLQPKMGSQTLPSRGLISVSGHLGDVHLEIDETHPRRLQPELHLLHVYPQHCLHHQMPSFYYQGQSTCEMPWGRGLLLPGVLYDLGTRKTPASRDIPERIPNYLQDEEELPLPPLDIIGHHYTDDTTPRVRDKLGRADVIEMQYSPNGGMDKNVKAGMESSLIEGHLARASRHYNFIVLREFGLDPGWKRT
ncbi:hypothetical protein Acr_11g0011910 [Actinidia rufa]|uniref:Uncharacterized protein n=1 Tax=Actinidia rufa TaxID=165716 RepID=A0A7J0FDX1_9ERIC|nr:hypothetical protein Acr_11g0011910 [Actinidia rufa]